MNKKYLSVILFGALMLGTTGTFTSCKDYDDDINNLQSQIDKLATKEDMEAKLSQMQSAINDAKATAEEALKAAQEAGDAEEIAKLEARVKALEDAAIDVDALKKEIADSVEAQMADFREEMEELLKKVEELTGYSLGMVTGISFQANDNGLSPDLNVNYARIATITYPKDLLPSYTDGDNYGSSEGASKESATSYEFGKGLSGAFTVNKGDVNTVPDYMLVNVDPVNAAISKDMLSLINGKGQNLNEYIDLSISEWSDNIKITRAAASTGLREISVQLKNTVDFEAFDKLVLFPGKTEHDQAGCNKTHDYIAYALAVTDVDKSRTVTSPFEVTMHVLEEQVAENIKGKTTVYSYDASIPEAAIGAYNKGGDAAVGDEGCYPVQLATPFEVNVNSEKGKVMASYIVVDYDNKSLSTTDKAALKGMTFAGVDQVKKDLYHAITISGTYATGIPVPLKLVTIDYTGNVEVNVFWVKVGEPVLMDANFTVTPTTHVTTPEAWMPASSMEAFKVPAGTSTFSIALIAGETAHQDPSQFVAVKANFATEITDYLTLYKSDKKTTTTTVNDVAYAKFAGKLNLMLMREDKAYEGIIKFYDSKGTYLGSNSISVKKVLPTVIPTGLTAKTNAIHADGTLPVYPKPGTTVGQYDLAYSFNFTDALKADDNLKFVTPTFVNGATVYAKYDTDRTIINIAKNVIGSDNTYPTTVTYDYGDIQYHPEGHGVEEPGNWVVTWGTKFNIKFGCYPVDSEYAWYTAPTVYYQTNTTILGTDMKDGAIVKYQNFMTVKNPYGYKVDAFDANDKEWTDWADAFNQGENKEVYLLTNGDRKNEFFTPSFVVEHNVTGLKLERNPSMTTVLEADVETTVVLVVKDKFGHTHEIKALTFTMKKDAK